MTAPRAFSKPARTFEQQADLLLKRGMVGDRGEIVGRLSAVNYYRLSAYWFTFRIASPDGSRQDDVRPGTEFRAVWDRYVFDQRLRLLMMDVIERIEVALRTRLAYHHAHKYGATAYADTPGSLPEMKAWHPAYKDRRAHWRWIEKVREEIERGHDHPLVKHFRATYTLSPDLPIWAAVELMSLRQVVSMYQGSHQRIREDVAQFFGVHPSELESWLLMLLNIRNICAHHGRLWNRKLAKVPKLPRGAGWSGAVKIDPTTVFAALTICAHIVNRLWPDSQWCQKVGALMVEYAHIPKRPEPAPSWSMGMPDNWLDCPLWAHARPSSPAGASASSAPTTAGSTDRQAHS